MLVKQFPSERFAVRYTFFCSNKLAQDSACLTQSITPSCFSMNSFIIYTFSIDLKLCFPSIFFTFYDICSILKFG